jgi:myo-inositol-1-phosphate synthase
MTQASQTAIAPAAGRLGVLTAGLGAVATTFMAGVESVRRGEASPIGSLTQMGRVRDADGSGSAPLLREYLPLAGLETLVFGAWDPIEENALEAARTAGVLEERDIARVADFLAAIEPMPAAFDNRYVPRLAGTNVKKGASKRVIADQIRDDIRAFRARHKLERVVLVWCGSTEIMTRRAPEHETMEQFERAMEANGDAIAPSMLYAWAAIMEGVPFVNAAPNLTADVPCLTRLAVERGVPLAGKDLKTGQTWLKTVIAPAIRARCLGLAGWFSTNILGNRDGATLEDPASFRTKEETKLGVLDSILQPELFPELYGDYAHVVRINYYPPRGDRKEGWDSIDFVGWMGYPMQMKIDFLGRDSILAAPLVLDVALLLDFAMRAGMSGVQDWMGFYFKSPMTRAGLPEHDFFAQHAALMGALRSRMGDSRRLHLDLEVHV